ncbi:ABC transporter substrate-binding protein [Celeribacter litoreus]|uniref:ABC transporter substrate-binding protein n=1 Tax=Celeribacter litoreus TaxID=2876714 RepID=UPI001CCD9A81|nr:ABC transporter substrate-binding protein [Celeribacter litoreus]MCA0044956.1 ABC transporter substrate-binding protein [Celeribacter litoreus]
MTDTRRKFLSTLSHLGLGLALSTTVAFSAAAADKVKVGVFVASSALPYYVGVERGYFADADIEVEPVFIGTHPLIVQAMVSGDIDAASNLVTLEGANINALRPGTMEFIALYGQNSEYVMEQFVVKPDSTAETIADLKGANLFSAPGPANLGAAKASLIASGLGEDEFAIQEQGMGNHIGAMQSGNFDGGFTLEALASIMVDKGIAKRLETGVIAKYLMKDETAEAYAAGAAISGEMIEERPEVAARFAEAWAKAVKDANEDPSARDLLSGMKVPENLTATVPLAHFTMVSDMTEEEIAEFQTFIDIGVDLGVVAKPIAAADVTESM